MKFRRQRALARSFGVRKLRGNPPRVQRRVRLVPSGLADVQGIEGEVSDPSREALAGLAHEVHRSRTQDEEMAGGLVVADPVVDDAAQGPEQVGYTVDLIEHDEAVAHRPEVAAGVGKAVEVGGVLQVEVEAGFGRAGGVSGGRVGDLPGQRGLADLPRAEQGNGGEEREVFLQGGVEEAGDGIWGIHGLQYGNIIPNLQGLSRAHRYATARRCGSVRKP